MAAWFAGFGLSLIALRARKDLREPRAEQTF
jgi:hypothetical protein